MVTRPQRYYRTSKPSYELLKKDRRSYVWHLNLNFLTSVKGFMKEKLSSGLSKKAMRSKKMIRYVRFKTIKPLLKFRHQLQEPSKKFMSMKDQLPLSVIHSSQLMQKGMKRMKMSPLNRKHLKKQKLQQNQQLTNEEQLKKLLHIQNEMRRMMSV